MKKKTEIIRVECLACDGSGTNDTGYVILQCEVCKGKGYTNVKRIIED
jgi:DnaJ-class molecular chaperone